MRQFDVFVFEQEGPQFTHWEPPFKDPALGWFHDSDWNRLLQEIEAEWVIFTHPAVKIDRDFLNDLAQVTDGFPMVDAFAPRLRTAGHFYGGTLLNANKGFIQIKEESPMRFVAAPHPFIGVFSRRIIQRTGIFDLELPPELCLLDYSLRMAHAGGKMFSVPYLVAQLQASNDPNFEQILNSQFLSTPSRTIPQWQIIYKNLPLQNLLGFTLRHPSAIPQFLRTNKLKIKQDKATSLSKLTAEYLKEIQA